MIPLVTLITGGWIAAAEAAAAELLVNNLAFRHAFSSCQSDMAR